MGAGASTAEASPPKRAVKRPKPSREAATQNSLNLIADLLLHSVDATNIVIAQKKGGRTDDWNGPCYLWGSPDGVHIGKQKFAKSPTTLLWTAPGLSFSFKEDTLFVSCDNCEWKVQMTRKPAIAGWLACYLHTFLPRSSAEYTVSFEEWGRLGIAFSVYMDVVIPVVFTVDEPARSFGVVPGSMLISLNGTRIFDLPEENSMLDFISCADFPKVCVFLRPAQPAKRLAERWEKHPRDS